MGVISSGVLAKLAKVGLVVLSIGGLSAGAYFLYQIGPGGSDGTSAPAGGPGEDLRTEQINDSISGAFERLRTPELSPIIAIVNGTEIHRTEVQFKVNLIEEASGRLEGAETWLVSPRAELSARSRVS